MSNDVAKKLLIPGTVGVIPTDTIYGVVARAEDRASVERLYSLKHRHHKPGTLIAANIEQLVKLGIKRRYLKAVMQFWPNPISVIMPCGPELEYLHMGVKSLAVRVPDNAALLELLTSTGPLITSSANLPGEPPANNIVEAKKYFDGELDFYEDGGDLSGNKPSSVIRIVDDAVEIIRQGAVRIDESGRITK